jgi:hypothetical protein
MVIVRLLIKTKDLRDTQIFVVPLPTYPSGTGSKRVISKHTTAVGQGKAPFLACAPDRVGLHPLAMSTVPDHVLG